MTYQGMLVQIPRLNTRERLLLLEVLSRSLREELTPQLLPNHRQRGKQLLIGYLAR